MPEEEEDGGDWLELGMDTHDEFVDEEAEPLKEKMTRGNWNRRGSIRRNPVFHNNNF
jgi:hypothetical protein